MRIVRPHASRLFPMLRTRLGIPLRDCRRPLPLPYHHRVRRGEVACTVTSGSLAIHGDRMRRRRRLCERGRKRRVGWLLLVVCEILRIQRGIGDGVSGSSPIHRLPSLVRRVRMYVVEHARRRHGELGLYIMMQMLHVPIILLLGIEGKRLLRLVARPRQGGPHLPHVHCHRWPMPPARAHNGRRTLVTILRLRGWCVYG